MAGEGDCRAPNLTLFSRPWSQLTTDDAGSADANEAVEVSLVAPSTAGTQTLAKFHPKFTYPIFGEQEQIFGYKKLRISLAYNANDMRPNLAVSYGEKFKAVGETEATDIEAILHEFLPEGVCPWSAVNGANPTNEEQLHFRDVRTSRLPSATSRATGHHLAS
jgi:hypothetical protein